MLFSATWTDSNGGLAESASRLSHDLLRVNLGHDSNSRLHGTI